MAKSPKPQNIKAVIYARYSSHAQNEQSIEGQLRDNHEYAQREGITVIGEYIDRALSGTKDARPEFQRMVDDAQKKQFSLVIVWKLDRFARNRYDSAIYKAKLKKYGVKVVSVKENITDSPEGIILEGLLESMAEYYSANLSQNIRRGQRESVKKGTFLGGQVPYGYVVSDKKLVADDKTAETVRFVFDQYASGVPKMKIIAELDRRGIRTATGAPFTVNSFRRIFTNTAYIGQFTYAGEIVPGLSQRIVDDEVFYKVQDRIKLNARSGGANKAKVEYLLQGKIFCGLCGSNMVGESGRSASSGVYNYYSCAARKKRHTCKKKNERKDFIETYVVEQTLKYVLAPQRARKVAKSVAVEYKKEFSDSRIDDMEKAIAQIDRELDKLVDAIIAMPKSAQPRIAARMEELTGQKSELEADLARLRVASGIAITEQEVYYWLSSLRTGDPLDIDFRRRMIDTFINSVYVYDDRIVIFYNIKGGKSTSPLNPPLPDPTDFNPPDSSNPSDPDPSTPDPSDPDPSDPDPSTPNPSSPNPSTPDPSDSSPSKSSNTAHQAPPTYPIFEPRYVFVNGIFGCLFYRVSD